jgi:hypothetical protein
MKQFRFDLTPHLQRRGSTGSDKGANQISKHKEVAIMLHGSERIVKHKIGLLNPADLVAFTFIFTIGAI